MEGSHEMTEQSFAPNVSGLSQTPVQEFLLYGAVDHSPALIFVADDQMQYVAANNTACKALGYRRDELLSLKVTDVAIAPEAPSMYQEMLNEGAHEGTVEIRRKDGTLLPFAYEATAADISGIQYWVSVGFINSHLAEKVQQLETALESRIAIEQAKGVLVGRHGVDVETAFDALRRGARANRLRLHHLASRVVHEPGTPEEVARHLSAPTAGPGQKER
jgi:PAS domain S-box-containing protein